MTWTEIADLSGKSAYEIAVTNGFIGTETEWVDSLRGLLDGTGAIRDATAVQLANTLTQTINPTDPAAGSPILIDWNAAIANPSGAAATSWYGPRGLFNLEGRATYQVDAALIQILPIGYAHMLTVGNEPGQNRTLSPSWGFMEAQLLLADDGTITAQRNDYAQGGSAFVDARTYLTRNDGSWDGVTNDVEIISFLSGPFALGNSDFHRRVGFDVKEFNFWGPLGDMAAYTTAIENGVGYTGLDAPAGSLVEQIGVRIPRLEFATRNVGIQCASPIELWPDTVTFVAQPLSPLLLAGDFTLNFPGATLEALFNLTPTIVLAKAGNALGVAAAVKAAPLLKNDPTLSGATFGINLLFAANPTYRADTTAITASTLRAFSASTILNRINGGTLAVTDLEDFVSHASIGTGVAVTNRKGLRILDVTGAGGTIGTNIGIQIEQLANGFANISLRSLGTSTHMRHVGPGVFGADAAPTNTSVGLELQSTTLAVVVSRMTSTQRDALTPIDGMIVYNTTTSKLQIRAAATWVDLH